MAISLPHTLDLREQFTTLAPYANPRGLLPAPAQGLALSAPHEANAPALATITVEGQLVKRITQAKQEERHRLGLCYNCDEKFGHSHNSVCKRLFLLDGVVEDKEETSLSPEEEATEDNPHFSLHAITGVPFSNTMQIKIMLGCTSLIALLDSGCTHNFISDAAAYISTFLSNTSHASRP